MYSNEVQRIIDKNNKYAKILKERNNDIQLGISIEIDPKSIISIDNVIEVLQSLCSELSVSTDRKGHTVIRVM